MKVTLVNTYGVVGGAAKSCYGLLAGLRDLGHDAKLLVLDRHGSYDSVVALEGRGDRGDADRFAARFRQYGLSPAARGRWFSPPICQSRRLAMHPLIREADIVSLHWVAEFASCIDLDQILSLGKPVVWTLHDERPMTGGCHYSNSCRQFESTCAQCPQLDPQLWAVARCSQAADRIVLAGRANLTIVGPSDWIARQARASAALSDQRIETIPYDVDTRLFRPVSGKEERGEIRKALRLEADAMVFMIGGASLSDERKGVHVFKAAAELVRARSKTLPLSRRANIAFCSFGATSAATSSFRPSLVRHLGFAQNEAEVARYLQASDIFVCPSLEDNLPNSVIEAMACGCPVIGSRTGGLPDLIDDSATGLLTQPGSSEDLARAMAQMAEADSGDIDSMRRKSVSKCRKLFARPRQARAYEELFVKLLNAPKAAVASRDETDRLDRSLNSLNDAVASADKWLSGFYPKGFSVRFIFERAIAKRKRSALSRA